VAEGGRRPRAATEEKRRRLLDATEEIMLEEGYAAVSSRRVAAAVGIQAPLVHYYFPTIDSLFVAVLRRRAAPNVERMAAALASDRPLEAWWELASDPRGTGLFVELLAAANHRPALKAEVGAIAREVRAQQLRALEGLLPEYGVDPDQVPPALVAAAVQGLAFSVVQDRAAGYDTSADEAIAGMGGLVRRLEAGRTRRLRRGR
jgi:AcrR family transcriptional regulator